ncbi:uncharacterized protein I303_102327 [Kwoniella dejecticola CBS 10117]|uniref:Uncharacterized protein n=1 Tax=Kwoniella dejecticola CBS 10117 TaxID=1296121 RepID=A0A1A6AB95_9TREE|nr:uncharacterized protein I303_01532 [Kwoniella dejecticola CBS 10117]OBR87330.1 hypothetical protein I303_01532 [Kwoniella dejecticola CBS 10117]
MPHPPVEDFVPPEGRTIRPIDPNDTPAPTPAFSDHIEAEEQDIVTIIGREPHSAADWGSQHFSSVQLDELATGRYYPAEAPSTQAVHWAPVAYKFDRYDPPHTIQDANLQSHSYEQAFPGNAPPPFGDDVTTDDAVVSDNQKAEHLNSIQNLLKDTNMGTDDLWSRISNGYAAISDRRKVDEVYQTLGLWKQSDNTHLYSQRVTCRRQVSRGTMQWARNCFDHHQLGMSDAQKTIWDGFIQRHYRSTELTAAWVASLTRFRPEDAIKLGHIKALHVEA